MPVSTRNKTAAGLAIVGGLLIIIGGSVGMVGFLTELKDIIQDMFGEPNQAVETLFWILIFIAALGGVSVIIGGLLIYKDHIIIGKILIALGAGIGIIGLIIGIITSFYHGEGQVFFSWLTTSFAGVGIILSIIARFMAKRSSEDNKSRKK
jgi:hypothetical protein